MPYFCQLPIFRQPQQVCKGHFLAGQFLQEIHDQSGVLCFVGEFLRQFFKLVAIYSAIDLRYSLARAVKIGLIAEYSLKA